MSKLLLGARLCITILQTCIPLFCVLPCPVISAHHLPTSRQYGIITSMSPLIAIQLETSGEVISEQVLQQWNMALNMIRSLISVETES